MKKKKKSPKASPKRLKKSLKKTKPSPPKAHPPPFPAAYGLDRLVLMVRDPWWLYAYWELTPSTERKAGVRGQRVLRVYRRVRSGAFSDFFDIEVGIFADNWYIEVGQPGEFWTAELGLRGSGGRFHPLLRSNTVGTPAYGVSDEVDPQWALPDDVSRKIYEASGAAPGDISSLRS